jgi:hypothetical protein
MLDELDDLSHLLRPCGARSPSPDTSAQHRFAVARLVSRAYRTASGPLRADILSCLLRPLGTLSLVAVASGAFARLLQYNGASPERVGLDNVSRFSSRHMFELAQFVHEENPQAMQQVDAPLMQDATSLPSLSMAAVVFLYRRVQVAPASAT